MRRTGILSGALWLTACSGWGGAQTTTVDGYTAALQTKPAPLQVGAPGELRLSLVQDGEPAEGCVVTFRQHMPGMEMSSDNTVVTMGDTGGGVYTGASSEYTMGGDWRIEVTFTCAGQARTAAFDYTLEWPE
ncbi:MAG: FixH family protein [Gammaproteobacteria bacterium]|nr:FixH family protein [Gammaproteobacteria bacterium]